MKKSLIFMAIVALLAILTMGCDPEPGSSTQEQENVSLTNEITSTAGGNNFRFLISDDVNAIEDFESVNVTISTIGLQKGGESGNWTEIAVDTEVDLKPLVGENATEIWSGNLTPGEYTKVFIYVTEVKSVLIGGEKADVKLPSDKLQISKPFTISADNTTNFVYDITVIKAGKSGQYILKPQIAESGPNQHYIEVEPKGNTEHKGKPGDEGKLRGQKAESSGNGGVVESEDTIAPLITVVGVSNGDNITGNVTITFTVTDDTDPEPAVNATLNKVTFISGTEISEPGEYELEVKAVDAGGNEAEATIEFEIKQE